MPSAFNGSPDDLPDFAGDLTMMLPPDEYEEDGGGRNPGLPRDLVAIQKKELRQMLDILAAVHCCWQDDMLPEIIRAPYLAYSADSDALDEKAVRRMRAAGEARRGTRALLRQLKTALPRLRGLCAPGETMPELEALAATAAGVRNHDKAARR